MHLSAKPPQRRDLPDASPSRPVEDYDLDRREVQARQRAQPTRTNQPCGLIVHSFFQSGNTILVLWLYNEASLALRNTVSPGGHGGEVIPVPIPNTEVKSPSGEGTAGVARGRVARRQAFSPEPRASQSRGVFFRSFVALSNPPMRLCRVGFDIETQQSRRGVPRPGMCGASAMSVSPMTSKTISGLRLDRRA